MSFSQIFLLTVLGNFWSLFFNSLNVQYIKYGNISQREVFDGFDALIFSHSVETKQIH